MTTRHTISTAAELYAGAVDYAKYAATHEVGRPGLKIAQLFDVNLGAADTSDANGLCDGTTCSTTAATSITLLTDSLDVPRNIILASTDDTEVDGVVTITGADVYGETMVEAVTATGTVVAAGKKAFSSLTSISVAACTSAGEIDIGWGDVLGLPVRINSARQIINPAADGSVEDFTIVVADTDQDSTAGDVRGTVDPTQAANGAIVFSCLVLVTDNSSKASVFGVDQYSG